MNHYYRWTVCPFGLSCSPYYFYKVLRPVITYLRVLGIRVSVFVDDVLLADVAASITDSTDCLLHTLSDLGLLLTLRSRTCRIQTLLSI